MSRATLLSALGALAMSMARANPTIVSRQNDNLAWSNSLCDAFVSAAVPSFPPFSVECARMTVQLDYNDANAGTTELALIRDPATNSTGRKGSVLLNPGGPGQSGIDLVVGFLDRIRQDVGPDWDIVSFAPRGVNPSGPIEWSRDHLLAYATFGSAIEGPSRLGAIGNLTSDSDVNFLKGTASSYDAALKTFNDRILALPGADKLKYVGTTAVARDVAAIVDVLDGAGAPINWIGFSYGTVIGMQLVQLFPTRVGKFILNGVVDIRWWSSVPPYLSRGDWISDADAIFRGFTRICVAAGPRNCDVALANDTPEALQARIISGMEVIQASYKRGASSTSRLAVAGALLASMYSPLEWDSLVSLLAQLLPSAGVTKRNGADSDALLSKFKSVPLVGMPWIPSNIASSEDRRRQTIPDDVAAQLRSALSMIAIGCGDGPDAPEVKTQDVYDEMVRTAREISPMFGSTFTFQAQCHAWKSRAVERYTGPWNARPNNTVLVVNTQLDPATPWKSARVITGDDFLGSSARLITVAGYGHTSYAVNSTCMDELTDKYFNENVVPADKGTPDEDVFCNAETRILGTDPSVSAIAATEISTTDRFKPYTPGSSNNNGGNGGDGGKDAAMGQFGNFSSLMLSAALLVAALLIF